MVCVPLCLVGKARVGLLRRAGNLSRGVDGFLRLGELARQLGPKGHRRVEQSAGLAIRAARLVCDRAAALHPLLGQLKPVLGFRELQAHLAQGALPGEALVLGRLHGGPPGLEFIFRDPRLLARLDELPLETLRLG